MKQTLYLLAMRVTGLACQGLVVLYLASVLPEENFGRYGLFIGFLALTHLLFEGGVFTAAGRAAAFREGRDFHRLAGLVTAAGALFYVVYLAALLLLAAGANRLDKVYFEAALGPAWLFAPAVLVHYGLCQVCIAAGRIRLLGLLRALPFAAQLAGVALLRAAGLLTYTSAALVYTASFLLAVLLVTAALRPRFDGLAAALADTRRQLKYGLDLYLSRVVAMGVYKLDAPLIALFLDFRAVGYYTLARALLMPFCLLTQSFASTRYKQYAVAERIPGRHLGAVYGLSLLVSLTPLLLAPPLLAWFFPGKPALFFLLVQLLAVRVFFPSASAIYNMYFIAQGQSRVVRQVSIWTSVLNLLLYLALLPLLGVVGVAVADVLDCAAYLAWLAVVYHRPWQRWRRGGTAASAPPGIEAPRETLGPQSLVT